MERIKWELGPEDNAVSESGTDEIVMYIQDMSRDVMVELVEKWNSGTSVKEVGKWLDRDTRVTLDECDYIVEQIEKWIQVQDNSLPEWVTSTAASPVVKEVPDAPMTVQELAETVVNVIETNKQEAHMIEDVAEKAPAPVEKKQTRTPRTVAPAKSNGKVLSSEDAVKALKLQQEKIQKQLTMIEFVDSSTVAEQEFPEMLSKDGIELLIRYGKDQQKLKSEYITAIQNL